MHSSRAGVSGCGTREAAVGRVGRRTRPVALAAALMLAAGTSVAAQEAAAADVTIWDGVYSAAQAERGRETFAATCARCHAPELTGSDRAPALTGNDFWEHWANTSLEEIFGKIRDEMPPTGPGTLSDDFKIDVLAYILQRNTVPAGDAELVADGATLGGIRLVRKGIWNGVYSAAQAARGKATFDTTCARCHNADLAGSDRGPALRGEDFIANWENGTLGSLFAKVRDTMPPGGGAVLEPETKLDIVAYILQTNTFPPGADELTVDGEMLDLVQIVRKGAVPVVPNFSLVAMVGCLDSGPGERWTLTRTTVPVVTREAGVEPSELERAGKRPLGTDTYTLVSATPFGPAASRGHKVAAKGLLYRDQEDYRLNLTALETVAESCDGNQ